jgi:hypothetical protein
MISAMCAHRAAASVVLLVTLAAVTACSSTTKGSGSAAGPSTSASAPSSGPSLPTEATSSEPDTSSAEPPSSPVQPAPSHPVRSATVHAGTVTYNIEIWVETTDSDCASHAYGAPVISYLTAHPCNGLSRLLATTTVGGKRVGFNQATFGFTGTAAAVYTTAGNFRTLVEQDGTGNINDLLREGRRLPSGPTAVPSPDAFRALSQDAGFTIVDAWYLDGPTPDNDPPLVKMALDIYLQY